jgi:hypothetical protein
MESCTKVEILSLYFLHKKNINVYGATNMFKVAR